MPTYPQAPSCNARGLTKLGEYLIRRMMATHMMIEADHLSEKARDRVLSIAAAHHYPLISSHTGTGGTWTPAELRRLYALGGLAAATPGTTPPRAGPSPGDGTARQRREARAAVVQQRFERGGWAGDRAEGRETPRKPCVHSGVLALGWTG